MVWVVWSNGHSNYSLPSAMLYLPHKRKSICSSIRDNLGVVKYQMASVKGDSSGFAIWTIFQVICSKQTVPIKLNYSTNIENKP